MGKKIDGNALVTIVEACRLVRVAESYARREPSKSISRADIESDTTKIYVLAANIAGTKADELIREPFTAISSVVTRLSKRLGRDYNWMIIPCLDGIEVYEQSNGELSDGQLFLLESGRSVDELTAGLSLKARYQRKPREQPKFEGEPDQSQ